MIHSGNYYHGLVFSVLSGYPRISLLQIKNNRKKRSLYHNYSTVSCWEPFLTTDHIHCTDFVSCERTTVSRGSSNYLLRSRHSLTKQLVNRNCATDKQTKADYFCDYWKKCSDIRAYIFRQTRHVKLATYARRLCNVQELFALLCAIFFIIKFSTARKMHGDVASGVVHYVCFWLANAS